METVDQLRNDINELKSRIATMSCSSQEEELVDIHKKFETIIKESFDDSVSTYLFYCMMVPIAAAVLLLFIWISVQTLRSWWLKRAAAKELSGISVVANELSERRLTHAAWRTTRRRACFFIVIKCFMAVTCLFVFFGLRFFMEASVRVWLRNTLLPHGDGGAYGFSYENASEIPDDFSSMSRIQNDLHRYLASALSIGWVRDLQSVYLFYLVGPGMLAFGLGVMRSAAVDVMTLGTRFKLPLETLRTYRAKRKEMHDLKIDARVKDIMAKLSAITETSTALLKEEEEKEHVVAEKAKEEELEGESR